MLSTLLILVSLITNQVSADDVSASVSQLLDERVCQNPSPDISGVALALAEARLLDDVDSDTEDRVTEWSAATAKMSRLLVSAPNKTPERSAEAGRSLQKLVCIGFGLEVSGDQETEP